jgi:hypothetical protein
MCKAGCGIPLAYYPPYESPAIHFSPKYCHKFRPRRKAKEKQNMRHSYVEGLK